MKIRDKTGREILKFDLPRIELSAHGRDEPIELEVLSLNDVEAMRERLALEPAEFTIRTLEHQARLKPGDQSIRGLPGPTVLRFARAWAVHPSSLDASASSIASYRDFRSAAVPCSLGARDVRAWASAKIAKKPSAATTTSRGIKGVTAASPETWPPQKAGQTKAH